MNKPLSTSSSSVVEHPADTLLACHEHIRSFVTLVSHLTQSGPQAPTAISEVVSNVRRFFAQTVVLHSSDEDLSVAPRLRRAAGVCDNVIHALDIATRQHPDIERVVGRLMPFLQELEKNPHRLPDLATPLGLAVQRLSTLWAAHLSLEEETIFPAMRQLLSPPDLQAIAHEIRERHAVSSS